MPRFNEVLYDIYQAALSLDRWPAALDAVARMSASAGALVYARGPEGWVIPLSSPALDAAVTLYRQDGWEARNPWLAASVEAGLRVGDVYRDQDLFDDARIAGDPFYRDFLAPRGLYWQMAALFDSDFGAPSSVVVQRGRGAGPFRPEEMEVLRLVSRHVEQALRISAHLDARDTSQGAVAKAFDVMEPGAFILDPGRKPVVVNRAGRALVGRYFHHDDDGLRPVRSEDHAPFAAMVTRAADAAGREPPMPAIVADRDGGAPLAVWAMPLVGASADRLGVAKPDAHTLLLAQPVERRRTIDPAVLRSVFGLTLGEARLAALVGAGATVAEAAETIGVTEGTARVVLKRVFAKTGVRRQAELAAKLAAFVRPGDPPPADPAGADAPEDAAP